MDVEEYDHVLMIGFSTPAVDQDNQPTFGAMVSCISMCIRLLSKVKWTLDFCRQFLTAKGHLLPKNNGNGHVNLIFMTAIEGK